MSSKKSDEGKGSKQLIPLQEDEDEKEDEDSQEKPKPPKKKE